MRKRLSVILIILCLCSCSLLEKRIKYVEERRARETPLKSIEVLKREYYANMIEEYFLDIGWDVAVTIEGGNKDILGLRYILMTTPRVWQILKLDKFKETAKELGFTRIFFSDERSSGHYSESWMYSIQERKLDQTNEPPHRLRKK